MREARQIGKLVLAAGRPPQCVRSSVMLALVPGPSSPSTFPLTSSMLPLSWTSVLRVLDMALTCSAHGLAIPFQRSPLPVLCPGMVWQEPVGLGHHLSFWNKGLEGYSTLPLSPACVSVFFGHPVHSCLRAGLLPAGPIIYMFCVVCVSFSRARSVLSRAEGSIFLTFL